MYFSYRSNLFFQSEILYFVLFTLFELLELMNKMKIVTVSEFLAGHLTNQWSTMGEADENSFLFPIFVLAIMALFLVPYTIHKISQALSKKEKNICCQCSICMRSGKYQKSIFKRVSLNLAGRLVLFT